MTNDIDDVHVAELLLAKKQRAAYAHIIADDDNNSDSDSSVVSNNSLDASTLSPYSFEPTVHRSSISQNTTPSQTQTTRENRIGNTYWCSCNNCLPMNTYTESTCCRDYLNSGEIPEKLFEAMCPFDFNYFANDLFPLLTRYLSTQAPYQ